VSPTKSQAIADDAESDFLKAYSNIYFLLRSINKTLQQLLHIFCQKGAYLRKSKH